MRVLLVEDDEDAYLITPDMLAEFDAEFELDWASDYDRALEQIRRQSHDIYLIDYRLGDRNGLQLLRESCSGRVSPIGRLAPAIILTGQASHEIDLEATALGVTDFLVKQELAPARLERSIRYAMSHQPVERRLVQIADRTRPQRAVGCFVIANINERSSEMEYKLELVAVPVSDVDRAKAFYEQVGFHADHDHTVSDEIRFVQLTPPGSACSIALGLGVTDAAPGSMTGLQLTVPDAQAARDDLLARGIEAGEIDRLPWGNFVYFDDPDGNHWSVQEVPRRG